MLSHCIVVDVHVDINNVKAISIATDRQKCVPFVMFLSYKIFNAAANNTNVLTSCKCLRLLSDFNQMSSFLADFHKSPQHQIS